MAQLYELNLRDYWNMFMKRRLILALSFLSVFSVIFVYTSMQTPIYTAEVLIKIDQTSGVPSEVVFPTNRMYWMKEENLTDYTKQITSSTVLEEALKELGLIKEGMADKKQQLNISEFSSGISALVVEKTSMIKLRVQSKDPQLAADLANKMAVVFKRMNLEQKNKQAYNVRVFIEKTLNDVSTKLKEEESRLRELTMQGAIGLGENTMTQIYASEQKRAELLNKYTENHPDVIRADEHIADLKNELKALPKEEFEYSVLKRDITINEALYNSLKQKLPEAQIKEVEKVDNVLIINPAVTPRSPTYPDKKKNYVAGILMGIMLGIAAALVVEHIDTSIGRVEDIENFIKVSVLGVIPFFSRKDKDDVKKEGLFGKLANTFFGKKPARKDVLRESSIIDTLEHTHETTFLEAFRILSVNLQVLFGGGGRIKNKIILITSCNPEEGKSTISSNLGITMAQLGYKTLIIDADTRRSVIHKIFGLKHKEGGLLDILTGKIGVDSAIRTATDLMLGMTDADKIIDKPWLNNLSILTAGTVFPNPINLFNSEKTDEVFNYLKNRFDVVLIDTSPILAVSEPSILIPKADGVLLVYKAGATSRLVLRRAKLQIASVQSKGSSLGIVLNNVTPEIGSDTYYYYNKGYYGKEEKLQNAKENRSIIDV